MKHLDPRRSAPQGAAPGGGQGSTGERRRPLQKRRAWIRSGIAGAMVLGSWLAGSEATAGPSADRLVLARPGGVEVPDREIGSRNRTEFPHLLVHDGPLPVRYRAIGGAGRVLPPNALFEPGDLLPPSIGSAARRERALALVAADDAGERRLLLGAARGAPADTQRILVLRVDFLADTPGSRTTGDGRFDLRDSTEVLFDPPPHDKRYFETHMEALKRYYESQLQGQIVFTYDVFPSEPDSAYHLPDTFRYGPWIFSNNNPDVIQHAIDLVGDTMTEADRDPEIDFTRYRHFLLFHAGSDFQGDVNRDSPWDIPSFNLYSSEPFVVQDSVAINLVMVVPETVTQDDFLGALNGVVTHEFGHQLGFVDLYDVQNGLPVVGSYSLMDSGDNLFALVEDPDTPGSNLAVRGTLPASIDPFHKTLFFPEAVTLYDAGLVEPGRTQYEFALDAVVLSNQIVHVPLNLQEYLLIENRHFDLNADSTVIVRQDPETGVILGPEPDSSAVGDELGYLEYDWLISGEGLVVWHIDWLAINAGLSLPGGGVNIFFSRPGIGVVEADGIRDIGTASSEFLGGPYDPFFAGGYSRLGPDTVPSSDTNDGTPTGITMTVPDSIGLTMRVSIETTLQPPGFPLDVVALPSDEQGVVVDLGRGGSSLVFPGVDLDLGPCLVEVPPTGENASVFTTLGDTLWPSPEGFAELGLAATEEFRGFTNPAPSPAVAAVAGGRLYVLNAVGSPQLIFPRFGDPLGGLAVTATPVFTDSFLVVGCADGSLRWIRANPSDPVVQALEVSPGSPVRVLAAGRSRDGDPRSVLWASDGGAFGGMFWSPQGPALDTWSRERAASPADPIGVLGIPVPGGGLDALFAWSDGTIDWADARGASRAGWPIELGGTPAGAPIVADLDRDGVLEIFAATTDGRIHARTADGPADIGWPESVWTEDETNAPPLRLAPRVFDVTGDGVSELLILRPDGLLLALDAEGSRIDEVTYASGSIGSHGPYWIPATNDAPARLVIGCLDHYLFAQELPVQYQNAIGLPLESVVAYQVANGTVDGIGMFAVAGVDAARSRIYPARLLPTPEEAPEGVTDLRLYPNPVRGENLTLRVVLGEPAQIDLEAFDLSGKRVAHAAFTGAPGLEGNHLEWDLAALSSGLYHVRVRIDGDGLHHERIEPVAILR